MNNSELVAYNYGRRLAQEAVQLVQESRGNEYPAACYLTPEEEASLERLGRNRWWRFVLQGGNEITGEPDAVPPMQT